MSTSSASRATAVNVEQHNYQMPASTYRNIVIGVFLLESLPIPVVGMGWVFALLTPGMLIQPTIEVALVWSFLLYPLIWLVAFLAALKELNQPQSRRPTMYAAVPALLTAVHMVVLFSSGVL